MVISKTTKDDWLSGKPLDQVPIGTGGTGGQPQVDTRDVGKT